VLSDLPASLPASAFRFQPAWRQQRKQKTAAGRLTANKNSSGDIILFVEGNFLLQKKNI